MAGGEAGEGSAPGLWTWGQAQPRGSGKGLEVAAPLLLFFVLILSVACFHLVLRSWDWFMLAAIFTALSRCEAGRGVWQVRSRAGV